MVTQLASNTPTWPRQLLSELDLTDQCAMELTRGLHLQPAKLV